MDNKVGIGVEEGDPATNEHSISLVIFIGVDDFIIKDIP